MKTYKGLINDLPDNGIFLFGSNPVGINGNPVKGTGGAALFALTKGWVNQGEKMDNKLSSSGKAWGLTTVVFPGRKRSKTPQQIRDGILKAYQFAETNKDKVMYVAYTSTGRNLNGYTNEEMASFFASHEIPDNVIFEEGFSKLINFYVDRNI